MRDAHRARALPNKKLPRGIERQDELLELIEKRFHQEDLIRTALNKKDEANAEANAEAIADERTPSAAESNAPSADTSDAPSAEKTADPAEATATAGDDPSADASEASSADTGEAPSAIVSDTTETVTIRWHGQNETITEPRTWLTVFDTVRKAGDVITREVADRRFHGESYWKTCDALYLSTGTYYHHVRAILHYAFACAVYHRLIDPRPKHSFPKAM